MLTGNERVLQARLSDAQFFWNQDSSHPLEENEQRLESLLFHVKLGTMADKTRRLKQISTRIAEMIGADSELSERAASLCKLDLLSHMVGEFASLQGTMGRYYALQDGEHERVADAIEQTGIGQCPFQGVVLALEHLPERLRGRAENIEAAGVVVGQGRLSLHQVQ